VSKGGRGEHRVARGSRKRPLVVSAVVIALLLAGGGVAIVATHGPGGSDRRALANSARHKHAVKPKVARLTTFLGPDGIESSAIIAENKRPGTTAWQISGAPANGYIEGFANTTYASVGETVGLYVSTSAPLFQVVAYRMGWYQGDGARQIWSSPEIPGQVQPACPLTPTVNMVSCDNWTLSLDVPITSAFMQGDYLFKLIGSDNEQAYVLMTIWDPNSTAAYLLMARSLTEEGWNTFGGYSYYQGEGPCPAGAPSYPVCNRARVVSFDRPYALGNGASDFLTNEFPLVEYMEENGLDVAYCTDITVDEYPNTVLQHRALLSPGHDETWTYNEREAAQTALNDGVNIVFFGAASVLRHSRLQPSPLGPDREEVDYRDQDEDPLNGTGDPLQVTGNTWSSPPTNWPETGFVGEVYSGYLNVGQTVPFVVEDASAWIFKGTGLHDGSTLARVVASDIDHIDPSAAMPSNIQILGHSPVPLSEVYTNQGQWGGYSYSDMTYYTDPTSEGGVFDTGTVNWIDKLAPCPAGIPDCPAVTVGQITGNLLWLFGQGPAGDIIPSVPNWQSVVPAGS
jgi:hypothetical protein